MGPLSILALESTPKVGPKTMEKVFSLYPEFEPSKPTDIIEILKNTANEFENISIPDIQVATKSWNKANEIIQLSRQHNIRFASRHDLNYPRVLLKISNPPFLLHVLGNINALNRDCIAIVGTRKPTDYGTNVARKLGAILAKKGYVIVSGLAEGIDSAAHQGALDVNGTTIAVLAHGLDKIYPAKNKKLANEIIKHDGALVSEYSWGAKIFRNYFIARDRIQSGLSLGVIVVETGIEGGTMHTVKFCKDQKRTLIVLKRPVELSENSKMLGNNQLILKNQADVVIENEKDIGLIINKLNFTKNDILGHRANKKSDPITTYQMKFDSED